MDDQQLIQNENEAVTQVEKSADSSKKEDAQNVSKNVLFGSISYQDDSAYENFLQKMNLNQAVFILIAAANFAQAKGSFNILESETLANAIRMIRKNSTEAKPNETPQP